MSNSTTGVFKIQLGEKEKEEAIEVNTWRVAVSADDVKRISGSCQLIQQMASSIPSTIDLIHCCPKAVQYFIWQCISNIIYLQHYLYTYIEYQIIVFYNIMYWIKKYTYYAIKFIFSYWIYNIKIFILNTWLLINYEY